MNIFIHLVYHTSLLVHCSGTDSGPKSRKWTHFQLTNPHLNGTNSNEDSKSKNAEIQAQPFIFNSTVWLEILLLVSYYYAVSCWDTLPQKE